MFSMKKAMLTEDEIKSAVPQILDLNMAFFTQQCLYTMVKLRIPDVIGAETLSMKEICQRLGENVDQDLLFRQMRLLAEVGIFVETASEDGENQYCYSLALQGKLLQTGVEGQPSMACGVHHLSEQPAWKAWATLPEITSGQAKGEVPFERANGQRDVPYYKEHPESGKPFYEFMSFFSYSELKGILDEFDWSAFNGKIVCDIAGCYGVVMKAVKEKFPDITTINFDLPEVIEKAESIPGVQMVAGDMFDSSTIPSCNVVFMKHILHDWYDEVCIKIMKSLHKALPSDGKVVICDAILPKPGVTNPIAKSQKNLDMLMAIFGGKERNQDQYRAIFEASGWKIDSVLPMTSGGPLTGIITTSKV
ncbi:uncharacterized protein [Clytia hemisphaerica]|uniref:O-methyltransferase n=3 Tax=Clytia hemisphaerica TaxID=252671 RepID=A0A7M5WWL8_9CNID